MTAPQAAPTGTGPAKDPLVGARIANCVLQVRVGAGGMGSVYLAHHVGLNKRVAVKILSRELIGSDTNVQRFIREAQLAAQLEHPNVVAVYDVGESSGLYYLVMQYVEGRSLDKIIEKGGRLPLGDAIAVVRQTAAALGAAHKLGIIHRDVKPANILVSREGNVKVADFGLARVVDAGTSLSMEGTIVGTPHYMAPEQAQGKPTDGRTDIYALGATLYHLVTGRPVFEGPTPIAVVLKQVNEEPSPAHFVNPELPPTVSELIAKMMAKDAAARFQTMNDVGVALEMIKAEATGLLTTLGDAPPIAVDPLADLGGETMLNMGAPSPDQVAAGAPTIRLGETKPIDPAFHDLSAAGLSMLGLGDPGVATPPTTGALPPPPPPPPTTTSALRVPPPPIPEPPAPAPSTDTALHDAGTGTRIRKGNDALDAITTSKTRFNVEAITKVRRRSSKIGPGGEPIAPPTAEVMFGEAAVRLKHVTAEQLEKCKADLQALRMRGDTTQLGHVLLQRRLITLAQFISITSEITRREAEEGIEQPQANEVVMFQQYRLLRTLAIEEMAVVWEAEDTKNQRKVAVKFLKTGEADVARLLFDIAARGRELEHPNIMAVYDAGSELDHNGKLAHYMAIEAIEGCTLADAIAGRVFSIPRLLQIFLKVTEAVQFAHAKGFVHGDLKPSDVMLDAKERPVVIFFGLKTGREGSAHAVDDPTVIPYRAPEQMPGFEVGPVDAKVDVWHIAVMLYEALIGRNPFGGGPVADVRRRITEKELESPKKFNPEVGATLEMVLKKALERDRNFRYATASELMAGLRAAESPESRIGRTKVIRKRKWDRFLEWIAEGKNQQVLGIVGVILAGILATWWFFFGHSPEERMYQRRTAEAKRAYEEGDYQKAMEEAEEALKHRNDVGLRKVAVDSRKKVTSRYVASTIAELQAITRSKGEIGDALGKLEKRLKELDKVAQAPEYINDSQTAELLGLGSRIVNQLDRAEASLKNALLLGSKDGQVTLSLAWVNITRWMIAEQVADPLTGEGEIRSRSAEWVREAMKYVRMPANPKLEGLHAARREALEALCLADWAQVHEICIDGLNQWGGEPDAEEFLILLGWTSGDPEDRIKAYTAAIDLRRSNALPYILRGGLRMERRETRNAAIKDFDQALKLAPETYLINLVRGRAHETKGDFPRALSDYNVALEKDGRLVDALVGRAKVRHAQGDVSGGDSDFAEALRLRKDYRWTYVHRGSVRRIARDMAGAEADYRVAIGLAPRDAAMHVLLGDLKTDSKAYDEAIEAYTEALRMDERHWPALIRRAAALKAKGLLREAADDLETALQFAPPGWDGREEAERALKELKKKLGS